ncbi:hypothetical protein HPB47_017293 [Ixodes persulcatus]|uniref:Uncharacterized protein n=1 Tax=Ixodes persulcatus TaxID=34615 RepID=A0AC60QNN5_IXOPE|nr:hypothetical protein HPB47_017293 [Ixodes persulcatus]
MDAYIGFIGLAHDALSLKKSPFFEDAETKCAGVYLPWDSAYLLLPSGFQMLPATEKIYFVLVRNAGYKTCTKKPSLFAAPKKRNAKNCCLNGPFVIRLNGGRTENLLTEPVLIGHPEIRRSRERLGVLITVSMPSNYCLNGPFAVRLNGGCAECLMTKTVLSGPPTVLWC